jgi:surfeit locus 1 family protein
VASATGKSFRPQLWPTIGLVVGCTICCTAGFWQLGRAEEKQALFTAFERSDDGKTRRDPVADSEVEKFLYRRLMLTGRYEPERQILLDNMVHNGRSGYQVLTPFRVGTTVVLVNRGWLPADPDRNLLPDITVRDNIRDVTGRLNRLPRAGYTLESVMPQPAAAWPRRLSFPTVEDIIGQLGFPAHDYQLLLDRTETDGFTREWRPVLMSPEKHLGYAIQWFMMAGTIIIIYITLTIKAVRRNNRNG